MFAEDEVSYQEYQLFCKSLARYNNYDKKPVVADLVRNSRWTTLDDLGMSQIKLLKNVAGVYCIGLLSFSPENHYLDPEIDWMYVGQTTCLHQRLLGHNQIKTVSQLVEDSELQKIIFLYYPFVLIEKEYLLKSECYCIGLFNPLLNYGKHKKQKYSNSKKIIKSFPLQTSSNVEFLKVS